MQFIKWAFIVLGSALGVAILAFLGWYFRNSIVNSIKSIVTKLWGWKYRGIVLLLTMTLIGALLLGWFSWTSKNLVLIILTETLVFLVLMTALVVGIAWKGAPQNKFFTFLQTGDIKFVVAGESWVKTIINIPGKILVNGKIVDAGRGEDNRSWLQKRFGVYFIGIYPFRKIHSFQIIKERENQRIVPDMKAEDWIDRDKKPTTVSELRWKFPRPILVPEVEFKGTLRANILVLCKFEVLEPMVPIFIQKAKFFDLLSNYVRNGVIDYCQEMTFEEFIGKNKKDGGTMSDSIIADINKYIEAEIGVRVTGFGVSNYESSDKETQRIMEAKERAILQGEADIAAAERQKRVAITEAEGKAKADEIRAKARITDVIETVKQLRGENVDPNIAAQVAGAVGRAERFTRSDSKITTLVDGTGGNVAIPLPGDKK
jgi:hypothetical protein